MVMIILLSKKAEDLKLNVSMKTIAVHSAAQVSFDIALNT